MIKTQLFIFSFLLTALSSFGQINTEVKIPTFKDKYSEFIKQLESGQTDLNYKDFRESFIESEQFKIVTKKTSVNKKLTQCGLLVSKL